MLLRTKPYTFTVDETHPDMAAFFAEGATFKFHFRSLTHTDMIRLSEAATSKHRGSKGMLATDRLAKLEFMERLTGWEDMEDEAGNPVPFTPANVEMLWENHSSLCQVLTSIARVHEATITKARKADVGNS